MRPHWIQVMKPPYPHKGYRYAVTSIEPHRDTLSPSLVCLVVIPEAHSAHDAMCRAMLGYGTVVVGGRNRSEVVIV